MSIDTPVLTVEKTGETRGGAKSPPAPPPPPPVKKKTPWYKEGAIYEVHVRAFHDSDGDGTGDFRGMTAKLDYLRGLGVTALWLLPFYPSPLKDDGYDISNYCGVHPKYGTLQDFKVFLREAHRRGLRVITELVINHTSDQHPWFQRARRARPGSHWRDYYVWNDNAEKYKGTRIIFKDTELSNWSWDPVARAYYWHRFYSHQPDLNFDHPEVHEEIFRILDFWLGLGVDGLRLDAVPYLYEREGTTCENLPETHEFLKRLRKHVDEKYADRMLLAEANQWPDDAAAYFGSGRGDECHMAFHFPLMPRLFMSLRMEDRIPIVDILEQTPAIPETAQWALFLRNHDELTLEMVTDEERDYMYRMYAHMHQARLNLGIRRRLAPLVGNDRKRIELLSALLFSLPGTPVIYYGDEIGMGENIYLGDRNGVRTPMQWSADKNAGFSRANPQSLYLPINLDPENHYEAVNVEVQERNPHSLLWWMKRMIGLHKQWKAFGQGTLEFLHPENRKILACIRRYQNECILVVANLSRFVQPAKLDLSAFQSLVPVELFGRTEFPAISDKPYFLTIGPHGFYWFSLEAKASGRAEGSGSLVGPEARALLMVDNDWREILQENNHPQLEIALRGWLPSRRWFEGKARTIRGVHVQEKLPVPVADGEAFLVFLQVEYIHAEPETYCLPLACAFGEACDRVCRESPSMVLGRLTVGHSNLDGVLYDALASKAFCQALLELINGRRAVTGESGELVPSRTPVLRRLHAQGSAHGEATIAGGEQSNSSIIFDERLILKFFRRLDFGPNPDLEIARFLSARNFPHAPLLAGALEYRSRNEECITLAILNAFMPGCKNAWEFTLDTLGRFYERVQTRPPADAKALLARPASITKLPAEKIPEAAVEMIGTYLESARQIGERTAELHLALASETEDRDFAPEPFTAHSQRSLYQSMRNLTRQSFQLLSQRLKTLPEDVQPGAQQVLGLESKILGRFRAIYERRLDAQRIRYHGDYHLGQLLHTGKDFLIIDFEGEPTLPIGERRLKQSPLRDVAGMMRSFQYAAYTALLKQTEVGAAHPEQRKELGAWGRFWSQWVSIVFYSAYRQGVGNAAFLPSINADLQLMMDAFLLRKAVYELAYELNDRPTWAWIPIQAILELANADNTK
jgi:maltose alpha-D-glucosyltransferase / alpha-amylase